MLLDDPFRMTRYDNAAYGMLACLWLLPCLSAQRLMLTPLLEAGDLDHARNMARVPALIPGDTVTSYSGHLTVNTTYNSSMFFWYFPSEADASAAPVVLWLQGGPGASSLFGLFVENGPYYIDEESNLQRRSVYWSQNHHVIYLDNPVGAGRSFTDHEDGYANNQEDVGDNICRALVQFFGLFPQLRNNPFFLVGQSYGGKYVIAAARAIHKHNPRARDKINLQGLAIGNGFVDPKNMMGYGNLLFQLGLIDDIQLDYFHSQEKLIRKYIRNHKWEEAYWTWECLIGADYLSYLYNETGYSYHFNFLHHVREPNVTNLWMRVALSEAIHAGPQTSRGAELVASHLRRDFMRSVRPWLEKLLDHYRVLVYNGQLDVICGHTLVASYLRRLRWPEAEVFRRARRSRWLVGGRLAGYSKTAGRLTELLVLGAGHLVPMNQPAAAHRMITTFTSGDSFA